jgi:hypothetical protein
VPTTSEPDTPGIDDTSFCLPAQLVPKNSPVLLGSPQNLAAGKDDACKKTAGGKAEVTSMMIRNLPYSLTQQKLTDALDATGFAGLYDFCYLPHKFSDHKNVGYAFVNFVNGEVAKEFQEAWHQDRSNIFNASDMRKALNVTEAVLQGRKANMQKAQSKKMNRVRNSSFRPIVLSSNSLTGESQ